MDWRLIKAGTFSIKKLKKENLNFPEIYEYLMNVVALQRGIIFQMFPSSQGKIFRCNFSWKHRQQIFNESIIDPANVVFSKAGLALDVIFFLIDRLSTGVEHF